MGTETIKFTIGQQCAPVLAGIKPSNLLIIESGNQKMLQQALRGTQICFVRLYSSGKKDYWLLFGPEHLEELIRQPEKAAYLAQFDYEVQSLAAVLVRLSVRFTAYKEGRAEFPHEMGVLFGYPLKDVLGFIENEGKNFKMSGYWKVYDDTEYAGKIFRMYEQVKKAVLELCSQGLGISDICRVCRTESCLQA